MSLHNIPIMGAIVQRMAWLSKNQSVISQNLANADTPGFEAQTLRKQDFRRLLEKAPSRPKGNGPVAPRVGLVQTSSAHMGPGGTRGREPRQDDADAFEVTPNGNAVVLEEELTAMANTRMQYGLMVNAYRKNIGFLRTALGRNDRG